MTIEIAPPIAPAKVAATKAAPANETTAAKEKPSAPDKAKPGDPAGFMAILASLGNTPAVELPTGNLAVPADDVPIVSDTALTGTLPQDATALLAQALQWTTPSDTSPADTRGLDCGETPLAGATGQVPTPLAGVIGSKSDNQQKGTGALSLDVGLDTKSNANTFGSQRKGTKDQLDTAALQTVSGTGATTSAQDDGRTEARDAKFAPIDLGAKMASSVVEFIAPLSVNLVKRQEQNSARGGFQSNPAHEVAGVANPGGWLGNAAGSSAIPTPDAAVATTQSYVAEQVSYWISNDVQKAEMKLDGLGDKPVEVSISMNGNQAHVAFRTDEVQARDALENASLQLKEMLQRDGVVLSGMSVGTSAGGESGAGGQQDRNARQGSKNVTAMVDQSVRVDRVNNRQTAVGRALDLFV